MSTRVRIATIADAPALGAVQTAALLSGYAEFLESTETLPGVPQQVAQWRAELGEPDGTRAWLAEVDGNAAGLVAVTGTALRWVCVMPERWGEGIGTRLMGTARKALRPGAVLELPEPNSRARRLVERCGWVVDGAAELREGEVAAMVPYRLADPA